jgi:hypothetical protein
VAIDENTKHGKEEEEIYLHNAIILVGVWEAGYVVLARQRANFCLYYRPCPSRLFGKDTRPGSPRHARGVNSLRKQSTIYLLFECKEWNIEQFEFGPEEADLKQVGVKSIDYVHIQLTMI